MSRPPSAATLDARTHGLSPATVAARRRAGCPEDRLWLPVSDHRAKGGRHEAPALWAHLEAMRCPNGIDLISAAALSRAIGQHDAWYSQQRQSGRALSVVVQSLIEAAIRDAATKLAKSAMAAL